MKNLEKHLIVLTGKETKSQLIKLLVENKSNWENSDMDSEHYFRSDSKPELLKKVKMYNINVENGGNGNISFFRNEEGFIPSNEVTKRFNSFVEEQGITEAEFKKMFGHKVYVQIEEEYKEFVEKELNGIVGNTEVEIAYNNAIEIYKKITQR